MFTKKAIKTLCLVLVLTIITSVIGISCVSSATVTNILHLSSMTQKKSNWCWAASATCAIFHYQLFVDQEDFVAYVTGKSSAPNVMGSFADVLKGLQNYGVTGTYKSGTVGFSTIRSNINSGKPIIVGFAATSNKAAHMVIIDGFDGTSASDGYVRYMDPANGKFVVETYANFKSSSGGNYGQWNNSLYAIRKT